MLDKAKDSTKEDSIAKDLKTATKKLNSETTIQEKLKNKIKVDDAALPPQLKISRDTTTKASAFKAQVKQAELAVKGATDSTKLNTANAALAVANAGIKKGQASILHANEKAKTLKGLIAKNQASLTSSIAASDGAQEEKTKQALALATEKTARQKLNEDGKVLFGSSKYQTKLELANEKTIKDSITKRLEDIVVAKEKHKKNVLKYKMYKKKVAEEERKAAAEANERKLKVAQKAESGKGNKEQERADKCK